ncbi:hypothetical protein MmiAt1_00330 [Methanimicrococcus sp. At1]|uniref:Brix domain-containing ribosomal biogenesis protein n=1 Tax=Methanimicrococcus hacksteinii TaxID=3028293 RepID=A0ABU3VM79_9EURY|nr:hypothetical protein [Methanimicrococcus sp. At1]MDV0444507.1 hypothetical protein [Methanimicrococcus sp. At1]
MMLLTSSRKPSFKTKILCKKLALFCDAAYMTRGKMSMTEVLERGSGSVLVVVGEYHGNPGSLTFYDPSGRLFLSLRFSETSFESVPQAELRYGERIFYGSPSSVLFSFLNMFMTEGKGLVVPPESLADLFKHTKKEGLPENEVRAVPWVMKGSPKPKANEAYIRRLYMQDDRLDFYSNDRLFLRLYVKGIKSDLANH